MQPSGPPTGPVVTCTLNTAIDRLIEVRGLRLGGHQSGRTVARVPAGKGVNVSRALGILGVPSIATGFVGRGEQPFYEESFAGTATQAQFLAIAGATRENLTLVDSALHQETHIREAGLTPTPGDMTRMKNKLGVLARPDGVVVFGGSTPPGVKPEKALELIDLALGKGARVVCDLPGALLRQLGERRVWIAKPNREEFAAMIAAPAVAVGEKKPRKKAGQMEMDAPAEAHGLCDDDIVSAGRALAAGVDILLVTCGADAGYLFHDGKALMGQVHLDQSRVRSTVGCGDALLGGFIAAQLRGKDVRESYHYALAVGTATSVEIVPAHFDPAVVEQMLGEVSVVALD